MQPAPMLRDRTVRPEHLARRGDVVAGEVAPGRDPHGDAGLRRSACSRPDRHGEATEPGQHADRRLGGQRRVVEGQAGDEQRHGEADAGDRGQHGEVAGGHAGRQVHPPGPHGEPRCATGAEGLPTTRPRPMPRVTAEPGGVAGGVGRQHDTGVHQREQRQDQPLGPGRERRSAATPDGPPAPGGRRRPAMVACTPDSCTANHTPTPKRGVRSARVVPAAGRREGDGHQSRRGRPARGTTARSPA